MDMRIELVFVPVTDVDRAIEFYRDQVGFTLDADVRVDENTRFVQLPPPGSYESSDEGSSRRARSDRPGGRQR
jgi:catechol 2,3-dioxygenase-like lactoylglutathione lyase family enzyme